MYVTKENHRYSKCYKKSFECKPEIAPKHFDKVKPEPDRPEKPGQTYNSVMYKTKTLTRFKSEKGR